MTKRYNRIVAPRIMHILEENKKVGMRFSEIFRALAKHNWFHDQNPLSENLKYLLAEGKVVHVKNQYCLIQTRENGTKFIVINDPVEKVVELEK